MTPSSPLVRKFCMLAAVFSAALLSLAACSPLPLINGLVPADTYTLKPDIAYGSDPRQQLDVYVPANLAPDAKAPVMVFFYGGNWDSGSRKNYRFAGEAFASQGMVTVVADYRVYPQVRFPGFVEDSAAAFAWAYRHVAEYGGDPQRMFVSGHSAGAYNAAMLAFNPAYLQQAGVDVGKVKGFIGLAGPYDFLPLHSQRLGEIFGFPDTSPLTQPITYVQPGRVPPPSLLITAVNDKVVDPGNSARMARKLRAAGGKVEEVPYPDLSHSTLVGALAAPLRKHYGPVLANISQFVAQTQQNR